MPVLPGAGLPVVDLRLIRTASTLRFGDEQLIKIKRSKEELRERNREDAEL